MNPGAKQDFIDINVAKSGDQGLIEQRPLDTSRSVGESFLETACGQIIAQGFRAETLRERIPGWFVDKQDSPELSLVPESKIVSVIEGQREMLEAHGWGMVRQHQQSTCHSQMHLEEEWAIGANGKVFATAFDTGDAGAGEVSTKCREIEITDHTGKIPQFGTGECCPGDECGETGAHCFHFRKLWHTCMVRFTCGCAGRRATCGD